MLPTLGLGLVDLPSYTLFLTLGLLAGTRLAVLRGGRDGVPARRVLVAAVISIGAGLAGARLWSAAFEVVAFDASVGAWERVSGAGLSVLGGLVGGGAGAIAAARLVPPRAPVVPVLDAMAPGAALAIAFGRVGCLLAGCCHGETTLFPIALVYDDFDAGVRPIGVPLHATPIYESIGCLVLALALWRVPPRPIALRLALLGLSYGILRASLEPLRGDWRGETLGWPTTQLAAIAMAAAGALTLAGLALSRRGERRGRENGPSSAARAAG